MLFAGHVGLTLAVAKYGPRAIADIRRRLRPTADSRTFKPLWTERLDDRALAVGAILPDIVDKPLALFIAPTLVGYSLRSYGHTLAFAVILLAVGVALAAWTKRRWPVVLALSSAGHLILDMMWFSHRILLWPLSGYTFSPRSIHQWGPDPDALYFGAEFLGLAVVVWVGCRLAATGNVRRWLRTGLGA